MEPSPPPPEKQAGAPAITSLLARAQGGDRAATDELFPLVYDELRRLADRFLSAESRAVTLQPTALVNEAYLRLAGPQDAGWESRAHFFGAAARAVRRILTDHARARRRSKRGGGAAPVSVDAATSVSADGVDLDVIALDEALERLSTLDARKAEVVHLRFFAGLSVEETAAALGLSESTVAREWAFARIWLHREIGEG